MRYFAIELPGKKHNPKGPWLALADEHALTRVLATLLEQHIVGTASFLVTEISEEAFKQQRQSPGWMSI